MIQTSAKLTMETTMNFEEAITAHQRWKTRLRVLIDGKSTETLDPKVVCRDDQCELGKWIHGDGGKAMGAKPEFGEMKTTHAAFHVVAGNVVKKALAGDKAGAGVMLDGDLFQASSKVIAAISKCKAVCK